MISNSLLTLACIRAYGYERTNDFLDLPRWRKDKKRRPSMLDIVAQFRKEIINEQLQTSRTLKKQVTKTSKRKFKKTRSRIENRKRGFVNDQKEGTTHLILPIDIMSAILYADC